MAKTYQFIVLPAGIGWTDRIVMEGRKRSLETVEGGVEMGADPLRRPVVSSVAVYPGSHVRSAVGDVPGASWFKGVTFLEGLVCVADD